MTEQAARYEYAPNKFGARPLDCDCRKWTHFVEPGKAICVKCELDRAQGEVAALEVLLAEAREKLKDAITERDTARDLLGVEIDKMVSARDARDAARDENDNLRELLKATVAECDDLRAERNEARELAQATAQEAGLLRDKLERYTAPIDAAQESEWKRARRP